MTKSKQFDLIFSVGAVIVALFGLGMFAFSAAWVAGSLGISAAAASQIVAAIEIGGWVLAAVTIVFGGGIIAAITATVKGLAKKKGRQFAIA